MAGVVPDPVGMFEFAVLGAVAGVVPDVEATGVDVVAAVVAVGEAEGLAAVGVVAVPVVDVVAVPVVLVCALLVDGLLVAGLLPVPPVVVLFVFVPLLPPVVLPLVVLPPLFVCIWIACGCLGEAVAGVDA